MISNKLILFLCWQFLLKTYCMNSSLEDQQFTQISIELFRSSYSIPLPFIEGCSLTVVYFTNNSILSLFSQPHPPILSIMTSEMFKSAGSKERSQFHYFVRQMYIFLEPQFLTDLQELLKKKPGYNPLATVISAHPASQQSYWRDIIQLYYNLGNRGGLNKYDAMLYLYFLGEDNHTILNYCYPGPGLVSNENLELTYSCKGGKGLKNIFEGAGVQTIGDCSPGSTWNLCPYTLKTINLAMDYLNFTKSWSPNSDDHNTPSVVYETPFNLGTFGVGFPATVEDSTNFLLFYCKPLEFVGSYWSMWTAAFDVKTWSCILGVGAISLYLVMKNGQVRF